MEPAMLEKINRQYGIIRKLKLLNLYDSLDILPHGELTIPVSYTHLDVYKRQAR